MLTMASHSLQAFAGHMAEKLQLHKLWISQRDTLKENYHLGITCFGGPNVHFQIVRGYHIIK